MEIRQNVFLKYQDYINQYPFVKASQLKCKILSREHSSSEGCDYFGDRMDNRYAISMKILRELEKEQLLRKRHSLYHFPPQKCQQIVRIIEGDWVDAKPHGIGRIKLYDMLKKEWRTSYEGDFKYGEKWGFGIQSNGDYLYRGEFQMGCRRGHGRLQDSQGNFFDGQFQKGFLAGEAICSIVNAFIIKDDNCHKQVYRKPQDPLQFTQNFSKLIHQIISRKS